MRGTEGLQRAVLLEFRNRLHVVVVDDDLLNSAAGGEEINVGQLVVRHHKALQLCAGRQRADIQNLIAGAVEPDQLREGADGTDGG